MLAPATMTYEALPPKATGARSAQTVIKHTRTAAALKGREVLPIGDIGSSCGGACQEHAPPPAGA